MQKKLLKKTDGGVTLTPPPLRGIGLNFIIAFKKFKKGKFDVFDILSAPVLYSPTIVNQSFGARTMQQDKNHM